MIPYNLKLLTYLAPSNVCSGVGVFSLLDIPKDTCIFTAEQSYKVLWSEINPEIRSRIETLTYCDDEGFWIDCDLNKIGPQYHNTTLIIHTHPMSLTIKILVLYMQYVIYKRMKNWLTIIFQEKEIGIFKS